MKTDSHSDDESQTISHSTPSHFHWVIDNTLGAFFDSEAFTAAIGPKTPRPKADRNHNTKIKSRTFKCCFNLYIYIAVLIPSQVLCVVRGLAFAEHVHDII